MIEQERMRLLRVSAVVFGLLAVRPALGGDVGGAKTFDAFRPLVPPLPALCGLGDGAKEEYRSRVNELLGRLDEEAQALQPTEQDADATEQAALARTGLSAQDIARLEQAESSGTSKADRKKVQLEMAMKMLQAQQGMTPEDLARAKNAATREAWGKERAEKITAEAEADPVKVQAQERKAGAAGAAIQEQKDLRQRIDGRWKEVAELSGALERDAQQYRTTVLDPLWSKVTASIGTSKVGDSVEQLRRKRQEYCRRFAPRYQRFYEKALSVIDESRQDYARLQQADARVYTTQTGTGQAAGKPGVYEVTALRDYVRTLLDVWRYDVPLEGPMP